MHCGGTLDRKSQIASKIFITSQTTISLSLNLIKILRNALCSSKYMLER